MNTGSTDATFAAIKEWIQCKTAVRSWNSSSWKRKQEKKKKFIFRLINIWHKNRNDSLVNNNELEMKICIFIRNYKFKCAKNKRYICIAHSQALLYISLVLLLYYLQIPQFRESKHSACKKIQTSPHVLQYLKI